MNSPGRTFDREIGQLGRLFSAPQWPGAGEAAFRAQSAPRRASGPIKLDQNENPYGPGPSAFTALVAELSEVSRFPRRSNELRRVIAARQNVAETHVVLGAGSGEILNTSVRAFASRSRGVVVGYPSYDSGARYAQYLGYPVRRVPLTTSLLLDLDAMAAAATAANAGLVSLCNPNNPTATVHSAAAIQACVRRIRSASPDTAILIDEAYHDYVYASTYATAIPLAVRFPRVIVARTFSKVHGMAGLRVGYAVAEPATIEALERYELPNNVNALGAAAAIASLTDTAHIERQRALNRDARAIAVTALKREGYTVTESETNFIYFDVRRPATEFGDACRKQGVIAARVYEPFPTYARVSIGTSEEMRRATDVFVAALANLAKSAQLP